MLDTSAAFAPISPSSMPPGARIEAAIRSRTAIEDGA
jgi:hypothetical protein